jgi:general secretion pathway protein C
MSFGNTTMIIQRVIIILNLALLAVGAYLGVDIFYRIIGMQVDSGSAVSAGSGDIEPEKQLDHQPLSYYHTVLERDLFDTVNEPMADPATEEVNVEELEQTQLKLKLWGTVSGEETRAYAVIEDTQKREQNLYRVGDSVQNATIKTILRGRVILSVEGKDEVLAMEEVAQGTAPPSRSVRDRSPAIAAEGNAQPTTRRTQRVSLRRNMINEAMQDISKLMTEITIQPHLEDGQPAGLALQNIQPNSVFRRMGLRNGDVLMGVDGQEIRSVDDALKLYQNLKDSDNVNVQLKRRGQERTINYNIR